MVELIAEIGQAHDGSLGILHSYIDALATTGVDTVKFQVHIAEAESSSFEAFRINFSYEDKTRFDYWQRMEFTPEQWMGIKKHCEDVKLNFLASPFSIEAFELLEKLKAHRYKIASGEVTNYLLLSKIGETKKPVLLSSGMSSLQEIQETYNFLKKYGSDISVFQCTTAYPTPPEKYGLNVITDLKKQFDCEIGLSDHSGEIYASLAAVALGATKLEFHSTFSKQMFGPDTSSSLTIDQIKDLVKGVRSIEKAMENPVKKEDPKEFANLKLMFGKSLAARKELPLGHVLTIDDLESKKPGGLGVSASEFSTILGRKVLKKIPKLGFLNYSDLEQL